MNKIFIFISLLLLTAMAIWSCRKQEAYNSADVELYSPEENALLQLPDTLLVEFTIKTDKHVDFAAISIVNKNFTPLFGTTYIQNPPVDEMISKTIIISALQHTEDAPYYVLVSVTSGEDTDHNYFSIRLTNRPLNYKGFYAFFKSAVHETTIDFYDQQMERSSFAVTSGDYQDSDISGFYERLYLTTRTPAQLTAYDLFDGQAAWEAEPLLPYPDFADICAGNNRAYAAMGNGQIAGYAGLNGQQQYVTDRLADSVPEQIIVLDEYLVSSYRSRLNGRKSLVSFYTATGVKKHQYPVDIGVVSFFRHEEPDKTFVFGNRNGEGAVAVFAPLENNLGAWHWFHFGRVDAVCPTGDEDFVVLSGRNLYSYDHYMHQERFLKSFEDSVFSVQYEKVTNSLFLLFPDKIRTFSYPDMHEQSGTDFEMQLKGIAFYYRYD
jgi:hypothetical protein